LPEKTTRTINRTNQNGDASDFQVRQAGEKITGTATLQRLDTSTAPPKSGDSVLWTTAESDESDYMLGYVTDVKVSRSKDSADVFEIGFLAEDFLETDYGIATGDFDSLYADSFTADGNDGFTLGTGSTNSYGYIELSRVQGTGDTIVVHFNADLSGGGSPNLALRIDPSGTSSSFQTVAQGTNQMSFSVTNNSNAWKYLTFGDGNANGTSYSINDFKIARTVAGLNGTKQVFISNKVGSSESLLYFVQGDLNGFAQTLDTSSSQGSYSIDTAFTEMGKIKYDLGASAGTTKTIQFKVAYPTAKQISGNHQLTQVSNLTVLSTQTIGSLKHSIVQVDVNTSVHARVFIGINLEDA
jgi:hypothetical protein